MSIRKNTLASRKAVCNHSPPVPSGRIPQTRFCFLCCYGGGPARDFHPPSLLPQTIAFCGKMPQKTLCAPYNKLIIAHERINVYTFTANWEEYGSIRRRYKQNPAGKPGGKMIRYYDRKHGTALGCRSFCGAPLRPFGYHPPKRPFAPS